MWAVICNLMRTHILATGASVAVLSVLGVFAYQKIEIAHLRLQVQALHAESQSLETSNAALLASLREQNAAINALQQEAKQKMAASAKKMAIAKLQFGAAANEAQHIKANTPSGSECVQLKALLKEYAVKPH